MKKFFAITFTALILLALPQTSDAGISCKTDFWGNYVCNDSFGNSSSTKRDFLEMT